jgi:hypothetical protein
MSVPRELPDRDDDCLPVMVPRSDKCLVPLAPERVERLRKHLREALLDLGKARRLDRLAAPVSLEPAGFPAVVARTACSLCRGWCCRNGGDDAFLDDRTLARLRLANPEITDQTIMRLYLARVPEAVYEDSCIFHGKRGCTLDRSMRADICNTYFCGGLHAYMRGHAAPEPTVVLAGEGATMRSSPVLIPDQRTTGSPTRIKASKTVRPA